MAQAKNAPLTIDKVLSKEESVLQMEFDQNKKYMFSLATENSDRENLVWDMRTNRPAPKQKYKPYQNIILTSQIVWNGKGILTDKEWKGRRNIRYYDGCESIFQDEQPKDRELIQQLIESTNKQRLRFENGYFGVYGYERMLILYMLIASWNGESSFKTNASDTVWIPVNLEKVANTESQRLDEIELAMKNAKEATDQKMIIHCNYLGIPTFDLESGNELSMASIRAEYRKVAAQNPFEFNKSYGDSSLEIRFLINKALEDGIINFNKYPDSAAWKNGTIICDTKGIKTQEGIAQKLLDFSQTLQGEDFLLQIKALYN